MATASTSLHFVSQFKAGNDGSKDNKPSPVDPRELDLLSIFRYLLFKYQLYSHHMTVLSCVGY